jgi:hypothetical protein
MSLEFFQMSRGLDASPKRDPMQKSIKNSALLQLHTKSLHVGPMLHQREREREREEAEKTQTSTKKTMKNPFT